MTSNDTILSVDKLKTYFRSDGGVIKAVDDISFDVKKGETVGLVGESGSGKTVAGLSVMRLIADDRAAVVEGKVVFDGMDLCALSDDRMRSVRGRKIAMIFQDPMTSLNPFLKISDQLAEITRLHLGHTRQQAREYAAEMLEAVGIAAARERLDDLPHEFSGGMRQRVMIAMALSCEPELIIADEPTTALDVTIQAQILDLIRQIKTRLNTSVILITHDLGVVAGMTDRTIVMYAGKIVEIAPTPELFKSPANPYTIGLLRSLPDINSSNKRLYQIPGQPPDLAFAPPGCPFSPRCERAKEICSDKFPPLVQINESHHSLCHFAKEVYEESANEDRR